MDADSRSITPLGRQQNKFRKLFAFVICEQ